MSNVIHTRPPNFEHVHATFPGADRPGVIFAYDGAIYAPTPYIIPPALLAHEETHLRRQKETHSPDQRTGADVWWDRYLRDSEFRYQEEVLAHAAEYKEQAVGDRNFLAGLLMRTAIRLVAPLYNYQPPRTVKEAVRDLRREIAK